MDDFVSTGKKQITAVSKEKSKSKREIKIIIILPTYINYCLYKLGNFVCAYYTCGSSDIRVQ